MFRDSRGAIPCTAEELFEQVEGRGDVGGFVEFHKGIKELLGAGVVLQSFFLIVLFYFSLTLVVY